MTLLVTGATGNIGRRVVDQLINLGCNDIRALTTNPAKAALPDGVAAVTGYLGRPETLPAALEGVRAMYLAPLPSTVDATLALARAAGVEYVVALSGGAHWQPQAEAVAASGIAHTQIGAGEFLDNYAFWGEQIRTTRTVREPYPDVVQAPVSMDDIARVAAVLLAEPDPSHRSRMYELTGPQALTRVQIAEQIGVGIGVDVTFAVCGREQAEQALRPMMGDEVRWYYDMLAEHPPQSANTLVADLTATPAQTVAQWAAANADVFR
ncbi:NAD(P)H-binding protein [Mycolicibacterium flavescens]|uniref:Hydroxylase n=1 Tax=Mycolicibacterium flavescens TaxID=1776 RepID=A0A1E3RAZ1_MYCFV|nr:NAD(P)H-binding protein [Mycolicibacterium flavescens]MCV7280989.1 NAD(P)H-binding protein [Mycolicibacterium flavescens]ODQ87033.1 hydroxylase [Mycolicibacterium flavescens]